MKSVSVKRFRGEPAKHMARSIKEDVEKFGRTRSAVTGRYVTKASDKGKKK